MKHEHWDDEQIEALLRQAPKMQDTRSKEDVFKRLQESAEVQVQQVIPPKKFHWKSLLVSIASIFILVLIASKYIGTTPETASDQIMIEEQAEIQDATGANSIATNEQARTFAVPQRTALYPDQVGDNTVFTIGLAGDDAESVPVSVLIPQEKITQDFADEEPTKLELYKKYAPLVNEELIGFNDYHPLEGDLTEEGEVVTHHLPDSQQYDQASASMSNYVGVMIDTFEDSYEEVAFVDEAGEPFVFNQVGEPAEPLTLQSEETQYNYFLYTMRDGSQYISPNFRMSYNDVETALANMTTEANDIYQTLILPNVSFETEVKGKVVHVIFDEELNLEQQDAVGALRMIEGILLTAAKFDKKVNFENILQEQWYDFDFTKPLPQPIAPNLLDFYWVVQ